jgi:hypothetical protein
MASGLAAARRSGMTAKTFFPAPRAASEFIRPNHAPSTKTILFLLVALTIQHAMAKSIIRFCLNRVAGFANLNNKKLAACAAKKR